MFPNLEQPGIDVPSLIAIIILGLLHFDADMHAFHLDLGSSSSHQQFCHQVCEFTHLCLRSSICPQPFCYHHFLMFLQAACQFFVAYLHRLQFCLQRRVTCLCSTHFLFAQNDMSFGVFHLPLNCSTTLLVAFASPPHSKTTVEPWRSC